MAYSPFWSHMKSSTEPKWPPHATPGFHSPLWNYRPTTQRSLLGQFIELKEEIGKIPEVGATNEGLLGSRELRWNRH